LSIFRFLPGSSIFPGHEVFKRAPVSGFPNRPPIILFLTFFLPLPQVAVSFPISRTRLPKPSPTWPSSSPSARPLRSLRHQAGTRGRSSLFFQTHCPHPLPTGRFSLGTFSSVLIPSLVDLSPRGVRPDLYVPPPPLSSPHLALNNCFPSPRPSRVKRILFEHPPF